MKQRLLNCFLAVLLLAGLPDLMQAEPKSPIAETLSDEAVLVKGIVVDNNGEPLVGVGINIGSNKIGTATDLNGRFSLQVNRGDELHFHYVGFLTKKVKVESHEPIRVIMDVDFQNLEEVVVVGYGTTKKKDLTGSIESIRAEELSNAAVPNAMQLLQGKVAGLYINSSNQDPGSSNIVLLRGVGSLAGSSEPLVVVDGLPINDMAILNTIASETIEQIDVLKDASATAIYGSRGANGVIIITTTSGKAERLSVNYGAKFSLETIGRTVDMMNSEEYIRFYYDLAHDKDFSYGFEPGYNGENYPYPLEAIGTLADTDWQREVTRNPLTQEHNLTLSGGNESLKYRISGNYYDGSSIVGPYDYKRYNFDSKITYNRNKFSFIAGISYTKEDSNKTKNSYENAIHFAPTAGKFDPLTGELSTFPISSMGWYQNPFQNEYDTDNFSETSTTRLSGVATYEIIPGLKLEGRAGFERRYYEEYYYQAGRWGDLDQGSIDHSNNMNLNLDLLLHYDKNFGKHGVNATAGLNYQTFRNRGNRMYGEGFSAAQIKYYQMSNVLEKKDIDISSFWNEKVISSYLVRGNYSYDDRYLLTANFRVDGATQFSEKHKWGYFPSVAFAWKINNEDFFRSDFFNNVKFKLGYGLAGNANIPSGRSQSLLAYVPVYTGGVTENGITWSGGYFPNPDLKWEGSRTLNAGFELGSRFFWIDLNGYYKASYDLLIDRTKPVETGYSKVTLNKGEVQNIGVELRIHGYLSFLNDKLKWNPSLTVSYNQNRINEFDNDIVWNMEVYGTGKRALMGYAGSNREGYPVGALFGYEYLGVWQQNEAAEAAEYGAKPGDPKFKDNATSDDSGRAISNEPDKKIDDADRVYLGSSYPPFMASFNNSLSFGDWSLNIMIDGVGGKKAVNYNRFALMDPVTLNYGNLSREALRRWTPDNPNTDIPSLSGPLDSKLALSTFCIEDASFIRLREVTLAWQHDIAKNIFIKNIRVYLTGTNLATLTGYRGLNPDVWGVDNSWNLYPITRSFILGVNLTF